MLFTKKDARQKIYDFLTENLSHITINGWLQIRDFYDNKINERDDYVLLDFESLYGGFDWDKEPFKKYIYYKNDVKENKLEDFMFIFIDKDKLIQKWLFDFIDENISFAENAEEDDKKEFYSYLLHNFDEAYNNRI